MDKFKPTVKLIVLLLLSCLMVAGCDGTSGQSLGSSSAEPEDVQSANAGEEAYQPVRTPSEVVFNEDGLPLPAQAITNIAEYRGYALCAPLSDNAVKAAELSVSSKTVEEKEKVRYYLEQAVEEGDTEAMVRLGDLLLEGNETEKARAKSLYKQSYEAGNGSAAFALGRYYQSGDAGKVDLDKALSYMRESASRGCVQGGVGLASVLISQEKYDQALPILNVYADSGVAAATILLAEMYREGVGVEQSSFRYRQLLDKAWDIGWPEAGYLIARHNLLDEYGYTGGEEVFNRIAPQAAAMGNIEAKGLLCAHRVDVKTENRDNLFSDIYALCREAAEEGHARAMSALSSIYYFDESGLKDIEKSKKWMIRAAQQADLQMTQLLLTQYMKGGRGFKQNKEQAYKLAKVNAELGYPPGMLAYSYYSADGLFGGEMFDLPSLSRPDYYRCALWLAVAVNTVKPHHNVSRTLQDAMRCRKKLIQQNQNDQTVLQKLDTETHVLSKKYRQSDAIQEYLFLVERGVRKPLG